ncbi:histidine kinase [Sporosarcina sp. G11-34]|nr:histidine kinase [Sporosarcina sp. G11-34]
MVIVATVSLYMLNRNYADLPGTTQLLITVGAMIVSGIISYFLFPRDENENS